MALRTTTTTTTTSLNEETNSNNGRTSNTNIPILKATKPKNEWDVDFEPRLSTTSLDELSPELVETLRALSDEMSKEKTSVLSSMTRSTSISTQDEKPEKKVPDKKALVHLDDLVGIVLCMENGDTEFTELSSGNPRKKKASLDDTDSGSWGDGLDANNNVDSGSENYNASAEFMNMSQRIALNVGGKIYHTFMGTILKYPDTLLGIMFSKRNEILRKPTKINADDSGESVPEYFFDRNGDAFGPIIDFYRTGQLYVPKDMHIGLLQEELDYWQLPVSTLDLKLSDPHYRLGDFIREKAISEGEQEFGKETFEIILTTIVKEASTAAGMGCQICVLDFPRSYSYKRHNDGPDTSTYIYYKNVIAEQDNHTTFHDFILDMHTRRLLINRLRDEHFVFSITRFPSIRLFLWKRFDGSNTLDYNAGTSSGELDDGR
eukprot:TRINITY_DN698_c1_g2_i1.p1 TRINITY_DN698_c1_g2~~TRINITY_DN698_c1_g2_i1.p1  ORF type:complete len:433 (+),score=138.30 TRINITY_DN698_c1_g2_i1:85-1383(+)